MGITAENIAEQYGITREEQDEFALASQKKAASAIENNLFVDEIVPITIKLDVRNLHLIRMNTFVLIVA